MGLFGYGGFAQVGAIRVLCREGASLSMPRSLDIPYPISAQRYGQLNYADGIRFPVLNMPAIPMDMGGLTPAIQGWFNEQVMNDWFITRISPPKYDLMEPVGGLLFSDNGIGGQPGLGSFKILKAKGAGFSVNVERGSPLGFNLRFAGTDRISLNTAGITGPTSGLPGVPLPSGRVAVGGLIAQTGITGFSLDFDCGLQPNMSLNGTERPTEHNADIPTCTIALRCYTSPDYDPPGYPAEGVGAGGNDTPDPFYPEASGTFTMLIQRPDTYMTFRLFRMVLIDPDDRRQFRGRIIRTFRYNCLATLTQPPLQIVEHTGPTPPAAPTTSPF